MSASIPNTTSPRMFICPGETHPISRSVHLSRLAAFYPACRECPLRTETGQLARQTVERLQNTERRIERRTLLTTEGVRGVYQNEITRKSAGRMAQTLAGLLWDDGTLPGRTDTTGRGARLARPAVVVGYDERPFSPDIATGLTGALRRMGCQIIDIGVSTKPCFWFTIDHIKASAGVFVTGAGSEPSWTGFDFAGPEALPWSQGGQLDRIARRLRQTCSRPTRQAGTQRAFQAFVPYEASLWKHFHALRPLSVVYACPVRTVRRILERIFKTLPCRLVPLDIPRRARNPNDAADADVRRLAEAVLREGADLGVIVDDDGQRTGFLDEQGRLISAAAITGLIADSLLSEHRGRAVVLEGGAEDSLRERIQRSGGDCFETGATLEAVSAGMREHRAILGGGSSGRYWFGESFPTCDAVLTVAKVLSALSHSDAPCSEQVFGPSASNDRC